MFSVPGRLWPLAAAPRVSPKLGAHLGDGLYDRAHTKSRACLRITFCLCRETRVYRTLAHTKSHASLSHTFCLCRETRVYGAQKEKGRRQDSLEAEGVLPWTKEIEANGWKTAGSTQASQGPAGKSAAGLRWRRLMWKTISLSLSPSMEQGSLYVHAWWV